MSIKSVFDYANNLVNKYKVKVEHINNSIQWLNYYGYLVKTGDIKDYTLQEIIDGVKKFQSFYNIDIDGEIGGQSLRAMSWARCGCKDIEEQREELRGWSKNKLSIYIDQPLTGLTRDKWLELTLGWLNEEAAKVCNLSFVAATSKNNADIVITSGSGRKYDMDGPSGTLAWHELPNTNFNGQLLGCFDNDERWTITKSGNGIWLKPVTNHEILGHGCGLSHSKYKCLMSPTYDINVERPIDPDDITQLQARYGKPVVRPEPPPPDDGGLPQPGETSKIILEVENIKAIEIPGWRVSKIA